MAVLTGRRQSGSGRIAASCRARAKRADRPRPRGACEPGSHQCSCRFRDWRHRPRAPASFSQLLAGAPVPAEEGFRTPRDCLLIPARTAREWPMEKQP